MTTDARASTAQPPICSTMMQMPLSLNHLLERAGTLFASNEIVSRLPDKSLVRHSYGAFYQRTRQLAQALQNMGLKKGERVATLCWNHHAHLECYFGIPAAGGVMHTLNLRLSPEEIAWIANDAQDKVLIIDDVLLPLYQQFAHLYRFERVIVFPFSGARVPAGFTSYEAWLAAADPDAWSAAPHLETDPVAMCYTSGTTGRPKGVVYSHRSTILHTLVGCMGDFWGLRGTDGAVGTPAFSKSYWVADALVGYEFSKNFNLQLNVYNLFDKEYVQSVRQNVGLNTRSSAIEYGDARSAVLSAMATWARHLDRAARRGTEGLAQAKALCGLYAAGTLIPGGDTRTSAALAASPTQVPRMRSLLADIAKRYADVEPSMVHLTISAVLQNAREHKDHERRLCPNGYESVVLAPECFLRFNEAILQACMLRACHPAELDYSSSPELSKVMKELLVKVFARSDKDFGDAALEFAAAIALGSLRLAKTDMETLLDGALKQHAGQESELLGMLVLATQASR